MKGVERGPQTRWRMPAVTTQIFAGLAAHVGIGCLSPQTGVAVRPLAERQMHAFVHGEAV